MNEDRNCREKLEHEETSIQILKCLFVVSAVGARILEVNDQRCRSFL